MPPQGEPLKKFRVQAFRDERRYSAVLDAVDEEDARQQVLAQGFEFFRIEPVPEPSPIVRAIQSLIRIVRGFLAMCRSQPIILTIPLCLFFLFVSTYQKGREVIRNKAAAITEGVFPQPGDWVILKPGYFMTESKKVCDTALAYQRSGNEVALKRLFDEHPMITSQGGMSVIFEGREGVLLKAAKVKLMGYPNIFFLNYEGIDIPRSLAEAAVDVPPGSAKPPKALPALKQNKPSRRDPL